MKLLTIGNTKTLKGMSRGYMTFILHLAPSNLSGYNVCPMASEGCAASCLFSAGRGRFQKIQDARIRKTLEYFNNRDAFLETLKKDIEAGIRKADRENMIPVFRLNGTSDIRWEKEGIIELFPNIQFYDYTKIPNRRNLPSNYHLTFSLSENNDINAQTAISNGMNVAAVFRTLPDTFMGLPVVNGDETDLRFLDPVGVVVGLKAKGKAKNDTTGFVRN